MNSSESRNLFDASAQRKSEGVCFVGQRRSMEAPPTPGRPAFSFIAGNPSRKRIPSKWDDAEKWLASESPAHLTKASGSTKISRLNGGLHHKGDAFAERLKVAEEKVTSFDGHVLSLDTETAFHGVTSFDGHVLSLDTETAFHGVPSELVLQDKFTDNVEPPCPNFHFSGPTKEGFLFGGSYCESARAATAEVVSGSQHRDIGTETNPISTLAASRCHTPVKSYSPARHNTPTNMSGSLIASNTAFDISELKNCHFAKLQLSAQYDSMVSEWSSREEEEAEVSKSLRHSDGGGKKSFAETRASPCEDEQRTKICIRYQIEEAKIQAWVNLQNAKAEAQSRDLEVKIQKMRSNLEEKLMKRMAIVQRRAEEWRAAAQLQHSQQILRASEQAKR